MISCGRSGWVAQNRRALRAFAGAHREDERSASVDCRPSEQISRSTMAVFAASNWNAQRPSGVQNRPVFKGISVT